MTNDHSEPPRRSLTARLGIDWVKTLAGALAAVSTAVLLSTLGAAGTLIGAAVGSIAATVGTAVYSQGLDRSRATMMRAQALARRRGDLTATEVREVAQELIETEQPKDAGEAVPVAEGRRMSWWHIAGAALATFVVAVAVVTGVELASGRTVSSMVGGSDDSGGTTISHVTGNGTKKGSKDRDGKRSPSPSPSPETTAPTEPTAVPPTETGQTGATPSAPATSESTPSIEPSATPTTSAEPGNTPSDGSPTASPTTSPTD